METTDGSDELPRRTVLGTCDLTLLPRIRVFAGHRPVGALPRKGGPDHVAVPQAASSLVVRPPDLQRWRDYTYLVATRFWPAAGLPCPSGHQTTLLGQAPPSVREIQMIPDGRWCCGLSLVIPAVPPVVFRVERGGRTGMRTARPEPEPRVTTALVAAVRVR